MRRLCDIPQMCTALISLTQHGVLGLVCAAGMLICSWKGRRCQRVGRQEEIKQEFLLSIFTPVHIVPFKYILIYCHPWKMLNVIPTFGRWRVQRGTCMEADTNSCPWKSSLKYHDRMRRGKVRNAQQADWNETVRCIYFMLHYVL